MGRPKQEDAFDPASDVQELLSVNSEDDDSPAPAELEPPGKTASPNEVRKYIVSLLQRRDMDLKQATQISAKWRLGTGEELREYDRHAYTLIFGVEDGWAIHKDVRAGLAPEDARIAEKKKQALKAKMYPRIWMSVTCLLASIATIGYGIHLARTHMWGTWNSDKAVSIIKTGAFAAFICVVGLFVNVLYLWVMLE